MIRLLGRLLLFSLVLLAAPVHATTYYVAKTATAPAASDSNNCTQAQTITTPKLTMAGGISCLGGGGDTLFVRQGEYNENVNSGVPSGSSWSSFVRIAAYFPETVTLKPNSGFYAVSFTATESYIEWDGINIDATNVTWDAWRVESWASGTPHHIRLKNSTLYGSQQNSGTISQQPQTVLLSNTVAGHLGANEVINCTFLRGGGNEDFAHAIYVSSENNIISGNNVSQFNGAGIQVYHSGAPSPDGNTISGNIVHDNNFNSGFRVWGIIIQGSGNQVYNNIVYGLVTDGDSYALDMFAGNTAIYNNTLTGNVSYGLLIENESGSTIRNNIIFNNGTNYQPFSFTPTQDHNLIGIDPSFIDATAHNYRLQNSSVAKNTGANTGIGVDIAGTVRPQEGTYDIGAYEYIAGGTPSYVPATGTVFTTDTFTDTAGDELTAAHTGETGATWAVQPGSSTGMVISANRLRLGTPDVDTFSYSSGAAVSTQYDTRGEFHTFTTIADHTSILWGQMSTTVRSGYMAIYNRLPATLELWAVVSNAYTELGFCTVTFADGSDNTIELQIRAAGQQLWYYPTASPSMVTQCTSAADTTVPVSGRVGIGMYAPTAADTNSTGTHLDKFTAQDVTTSGATSSCGNCRLRFKR